MDRARLARRASAHARGWGGWTIGHGIQDRLLTDRLAGRSPGFQRRSAHAGCSPGIGALDLFRSLPLEALGQVRAATYVDRVARDAVICGQGMYVERAYALAAGSVRIVQTDNDGGQAIVRFIGPGEMFGAVPLFTDHHFPADAIAAESSTVLSWNEQDLLRLIADYPAVAINVIRAIGMRLAQLQERVRELTTQRAEQRIAHAILRLAGQAGRDGSRGTTIEIPLRCKDLVEFAGTTLHTGQPDAGRLEKAGLLASSGQRLTIRDFAALRSLAESSPA